MTDDFEHTNRHWYLVSYDIRNETRWRMVYKTVRGYGERIQYSLFRCRLTRTELEELRCLLEGLLADEDDLLIIHLCPLCARHVEERGAEAGWEMPRRQVEIL